jgi:alkylation response protein AidB-like acyl-CoA dehydrogenase
MKSFDEFSKPEEYIGSFDKHFRSVIRSWASKEVMPFRRKYDEDWKTHHLIEPAFEKLMGDKGVGIQKALFPPDLGGWGIGQSDYAFTFACTLAEEVGRADTAMAVAFMVTFWPLTAIVVEPHVNWRLAKEFAPMF